MEILNPVKKGDAVIVRKDIAESGIDLFHIGITSSMIKQAGKVVVVKEMFDRARSGHDQYGEPLPYKVQTFSVKGMSESWTTNLIVPLDADVAFDALVRGHINEKTYKEATKETL